MAGRWIGPFPPEIFLDGLMPISDTDLANVPKDVKFTMPAMVEGKDPLEKELYKEFVSTIANNDLSPNMQFFISADKTSDGVAYRPDAGFKEIRCVPPTSPARKRAKETKAAQKQPKTTNKPQAFDWCHDTLVVEFKRLDEHDPFYTSADIITLAKRCPVPSEAAVPFERPGLQSRKIRGQLILYASEVFGHQQRLHLFQLLVFGQYARFIYFDHAGAIVSERVDYVEDSSLLVEFMWRFNHISDVERGRDPTAVDALPNEEKRFISAVGEFLENMKNPGQLVLPNADRTMSGKYPIKKMLVQESDERKMELLIRRPTVKSHSVLGRATQGYIAVEAQNSEEVLFLKDSWRVHHELAKTETEIYRILERYGVPHIPRVICGGDVRGPGGDDQVQSTKSAQWIRRQDLPVGYANLRDHVHHRMVQRIAYPIEAATNSKQYTRAFSNVIEVIERADGDECKILHRDISIGNVMLSGKDGEDDAGLLGDWDHARVTIPGEARERQKYRTGTWAFMSIGLLQNPKKAHEILDDFESIFWTKLYGALHRFKHTGGIDMGVFTENHPKVDAGYTDLVVGGDRKYTILAMFPLAVKFSCKPLQTLLKRIARAIKDYYDAKYRLSSAEDAAANDPDEDQDDDLSEAREMFEMQHAKLSDPKFWKSTFKLALDRKDWELDDLMLVDPYPIRTEEQETQQIESSLGKEFERKNQSESSKVTDEDPDKLEFRADPEAIETERDPRIPLIPASYYRRGLDAEDHEPVPRPAGVSRSSSPLRQEVEGSGATQVGTGAFSSGSSSTESIFEQARKRKRKDRGGKTAGSSKPEGPMQKRTKHTQVPAPFPSTSNTSSSQLAEHSRPRTRLATARQLSGEASVGASGLSRLSISPMRKTQASLKGKDKAKGRGKGTMRSRE
ncbi:hypothetical protein BDY19DRAFT_1057943 [Irpex rosettiformis]|uniref:Uncharacterized protein n=1 Tax=Irpex rosettiformis TaxID=378272 RepID=A0ACB8U0K8_9APHY|nr:hypothetical protein BDY19DRAFT_1057943 [Irpex rosettiformis]